MLHTSKSIQGIQRILAKSHTPYGRISARSATRQQGYHGGISNNAKCYFLAPSSTSSCSKSNTAYIGPSTSREYVSLSNYDHDSKYQYRWSNNEKTSSQMNNPRYFHSSQAIFQSNYEKEIQNDPPSTSQDHQTDSSSNENTNEYYQEEYHNHNDHPYTHEASPSAYSNNYNYHQNLTNSYQYKNSPQNQRNALINFTHEILSNTPIGSMTTQQIEDTRSLIYEWFSALYQPNTSEKSSSKNSNNHTNHHSIPHQRARDTALIMETLLERLIEEYDEGLNENALGAVRIKEYNIVMNAFAKSVSSYYNDKNLNWKRKIELDVNNIENDHDYHHDNIDSDNNNGNSIDAKYHDQQRQDTSNQSDFYVTTTDPEEDYMAITKAEELVQRMKTRFENYANLFPDQIEKTNVNNKNNLNGFDDRIPPKPDTLTYNTLLSVYANQYNNEKAVAKAEEIIKFLESSDGSVQADTVTYNTLINIYANQIGEYGYAQKAEDVLLYMSKLRKEGSEFVKPHTLTFNSVLKAWRNSGGGTVECESPFLF